MSNIRVGTCSWAEKSLIESGEFYPKGVSSAEERLRFYASHFDTVEVDSTYYAYLLPGQPNSGPPGPPKTSSFTSRFTVP